jgi:hypothetical protein
MKFFNPDHNYVNILINYKVLKRKGRRRINKITLLRVP